MQPGIFLSHNSRDKTLVESLRHLLEARGLPAWLDRDSIPEHAPPEVWMPHVRAAVDHHPVALICLGPHGFGPIHQREVDAILPAFYADETRRVVPVLLPGARPEEVPALLRPFTLVDLRGVAQPSDGATLRPGPWLDALVELAGGLDQRRLPPDLDPSAPAVETPALGSPYRGLRVFERTHRDLFFGRAADVARLMNRVGEASTAGRRFLVLTGSSGAGKSSLVLAGLLPTVERYGLPKKDEPDQWVAASTRVLRVGERPALEVLAEATGLTVTDLEAELPADFDPYREGPCEALARALVEPVLLVVDQAEELFTGERTPERTHQRDLFLAHLLRAAHHPDRACTVLLTVRADHLVQLFDHSPALNQAMTTGQIVLPDLRHDTRRLAIEGPARLAGRGFEAGVVPDLVRALDAQPGHLPLLQFALDQWWRSTPSGDLSRATYDTIGGLEGAIAHHADATLDRLEDRTQALHLLEDLVHLGEGTADTRRPRPRAELQPAGLVEQLLEARLLTAQEAWIELAHDSLVRHWPTLRTHIDKVREVLRTDRQTEDLARGWEKGGGELLKGPRLKLLDERMKRPGRAPSQLLRRFHEASAKARTRRRWTWGTGSAVILATLAAVGTVAFVQNRNAAEQGRIAAERLDKGIEVAARIGLRVQNELTDSRDVPTLRNQLLADMAELLRTLDPQAEYAKAQRMEAARLGLLGDGLKEAGDLPEARTHYEAALAIAQRLAETEAGQDVWLDLSVHHDALGDLARAMGDLPQAHTHYEAAQIIRKRVTEADPRNTDGQRGLSISHHNLGILAVAAGDLAGARTHYETAQAIARRLAEADSSNPQWQRDLAVGHINLGDLAVTAGDRVEARTQYAASHEISKRLAEADPRNTKWQRDLSISHNKLGDLARATGDLAEARAQYDARQAIAKRLAETDPSNTEWQRDLSVGHDKLGDLARTRGDLAEARVQYEASEATTRRLAAADPLNARWQRDLSICHNKLGDLARAAGDLIGASTHYEADLAIAQRLAEVDPSNAQWQRDWAISHIKLGDLAAARGDLPAVHPRYEAGHAIFKRLAETDPSSAQGQGDLVASYQRLATLETRSGNFAGARLHLDTALALLAHRLAEGGEAVKNALFLRLLAAAIEAKAGDATASAAHVAEARRLLAILDARGEFQGDAKLDQIRGQLNPRP